MALRIFHLSDLHFGDKFRFGKSPAVELTRLIKKSLESLDQNPSSGSPVDLVIATGDLTQTAKPKEFEQAEQFFSALSREFGLERSRFVFVPGNHDVAWTQCRIVAEEQEEEGFDEEELQSRLHDRKFKFYRKFLEQFYGPGKTHGTPLKQEARVRDFPDLRLSVASLNSCEKETHQEHIGFLGKEQMQSHLPSSKAGKEA